MADLLPPSKDEDPAVTQLADKLSALDDLIKTMPEQAEKLGAIRSEIANGSDEEFLDPDFESEDYESQFDDLDFEDSDMGDSPMVPNKPKKKSKDVLDLLETSPFSRAKPPAKITGTN